MKDRRNKKEPEFDGEEFFLKPGHIFFSTEPSVVRTVLGSCVSVCLWDKVNHFGGINHFLYPETREKENATPKFGNAATVALIKIMEDASCKTADLVGQIFGGAYLDGSEGKKLGEKNVETARKVLHRKGIKILSEDVGGTLGRKIMFDTQKGHVVVLKVHKIRESDWY